MKSRHYRNSLEFIERGFRCCLQNVGDLTAAAEALLKDGLHAPAMSLSVLALEEVGKLVSLDGLLFADPKDDKSGRFKQSERDHDMKLRAVLVSALFIQKYAEFDPRWKSEERFRKTIGISIVLLKNSGQQLLDDLVAPDFSPLDKWKQNGFYVRATESGLQAPRESVTKPFAELVVIFVQQLAGTLKFVLNDAVIHDYFNMAMRVRKTLSEHDHKLLETIAQGYFGKWSEDQKPSTLN